ncbi:hypothetical protein EDB84DRAFT_1546540 [Lactarius hengduanensis]|nr:hypothetical protein EDB84DRAFT_1546540 [Lactarius hengduanensis]
MTSLSYESLSLLIWVVPGHPSIATYIRHGSRSTEHFKLQHQEDYVRVPKPLALSVLSDPVSRSSCCITHGLPVTSGLTLRHALALWVYTPFVGKVQDI